ncbi:hypothetical protein CAEBREN_02068 [Caenorhabditis brenneri]|uniref:SPK domain-containing protein n=1 Tax=Caenorhabditis brenneri TaxID=135651 RepID=G0MU66_CAEBE|nr:hypothetical protein CAEBREN_02068 [Caenorhabditis brenneri]
MTSLSVENANSGSLPRNNQHLQLIPEKDILAAVGSLFLEGKKRRQNRKTLTETTQNEKKKDRNTDVQVALLNLIQILARASLKNLEDDDIMFAFRSFYPEYEITDEQLLEEIQSAKLLIEFDDTTDIFTKVHTMFIFGVPVTENFLELGFLRARGYHVNVNELKKITDYSANVSVNYSVEGSCLIESEKDAFSQTEKFRAQLHMTIDTLPSIQKRILNMLINIGNYSIQIWDDKKLYEEFNETSSMVYQDFIKELKSLKAKIEKIGDLNFVTKLKIHFMTQSPIKAEVGGNVEKDFELKLSQERTISAMKLYAKLTMSTTKGSLFENLQPKRSDRGTASRKIDVLPTSSKCSEDKLLNIESSRHAPSTNQPLVKIRGQKAIGKEKKSSGVQENDVMVVQSVDADQTSNGSNARQTTPNSSTQGASPTSVGPQYKVGAIIKEILSAMEDLDAPQLGELRRFCEEILKRPEILSKEVFLNQFLLGMRLCLRMLRKKSFAECEPGILVDSGNVLKSLVEIGRKVSSTEDQRPESLASLMHQMKNIKRICDRNSLKIPIETLKTSFWMFVRIVVSDTLTNSVALQHMRVFVALGDRSPYTDTSSSEAVDVLEMLRIITNGVHVMPTLDITELFNMLLANIAEAKDKKTNCLDVVEAVEECLCLVLHSSSEQIRAEGCVETNKVLNVLLEFSKLLTSNDVVVQERISKLFNILLVALKECEEFKIRQPTVIQILKMLMWNATDVETDLARGEVQESV